MTSEGPCMHCKMDKPVFRHNVYYNDNVLQLCTSCLLKMYKGAFCPICFKVYEKEDVGASPPELVHCSMCPAIAHFNCAARVLPSTSSSSSTPTSHYICQSCSDPKFKFFYYQRDEKTRLACIDKRLAQQLLAASIISQRSMKEGAALCWQRVEINAAEAVNAQKKAKNALAYLAELNMAKKTANEDTIETKKVDES